MPDGVRAVDRGRRRKGLAAQNRFARGQEPGATPTTNDQEAESIPTAAQRLDSWIRSRSVVVLLILITLLLSALAVLIGAGHSILNWYRSEFEVQAHEASTLRQLNAGMTVERFTQELGAPLFHQVSSVSKYTDNTYQGRDFWVQTIQDSNSTVVFFSVTSCNPGFAPTFPIAGLSQVSVTLNRTLMADVATQAGWYSWLSGATANSWMYDFVYGGNPGNYETYVWGVNDACPAGLQSIYGAAQHSGDFKAFLQFQVKSQFGDDLDNPSFIAQFDPDYGEDLPAFSGRRTPVSTLSNKVLTYVQRHERVNTFGVTEPGFMLSSIPEDFQIGVDRLVVRTIP